MTRSRNEKLGSTRVSMIPLAIGKQMDGKAFAQVPPDTRKRTRHRKDTLKIHIAHGNESSRPRLLAPHRFNR
jgi:hypothetical protein